MDTKQKILIVDDRHENIFSLKRILADTKAEIIEAFNGNDALIASLNHDFALAILDVQMPEMDGYELAEFLRSETKTRNIPIIFVSAVYSSDYHIFKGYESGAVDFLAKPFDAKILLSKVNIFLELDSHKKELVATKRSLQEQLFELKNAENRFQSLVETIPDIVYRTDSNGCFTFVNDAVEKIGYKPEELKDQHFSILMRPDDVEGSSFDTAVKNQKSIGSKRGLQLFDERRTGHRKTTGFEIELIPKNDQKNVLAELELDLGGAVVMEVNSTGLYSDDSSSEQKKHLGSVGVIRDISQRKRMEDALRKANEELERRVAERTRALVEKNKKLTCEIELKEKAEQQYKKSQKKWEETFEAIGHMAIVVDTKHSIIAVNNTTTEHTGISKTDLMGSSCQGICHISGKKDSLCPMEQFRKEPTSTTIELEVEAWGRSYICNITPFYDSGGELDKLIHIFTDITKRKALEKELIQAHKMEAIGTLAGGIAHDFNNILSGLIGFTQLALRNVEKESLLEEDLNEILTCGFRAKDLVRQILTFARQADEERSIIHIDYIVKEVTKFIKSTTPSSITVQTDIQSSATIFADPTQIHQVLMNLCTNAVYAMKDGDGVLSISLTEENVRHIESSADNNIPSGHYVRITVSDTGTGISQNVVDKMYEPYFTTKPQGEGTGMGLAVVLGIVKGVGGVLDVQTELGQGTAFTILIPVAGEEHEPCRDVQSAVKAEVGSGHILFVDDEAQIIKFVKRMLGNHGYQVTGYRSSVEGLAAFKESPHLFDLIITDLTMPKMTGDKFLKKIKEIKPEMPTILCSGYQDKELIKDKTDIIWTAFIQKPIEETTLINTIRTVLDKGK